MKCDDLARPVTADEIGKEIAGKTIPYEDIAREHAEEPSGWYLEKGHPTYANTYDIVNEERSIKSDYKVQIEIDKVKHNHKVTLLRGSLSTGKFKPAQNVPCGFAKQAIEKLNLK